ncbi:MAG: TonB-dependent receptor [Wenzhouxiangellaceae bacterium]
MKINIPHCAFGSVLLLQLCSIASAQQLTDIGDDATNLEQMTVTATRGSTRPVDTLPLSTTILDREDILNAPGRTLDEVLRQVPGLQLPLLNSTANFPVNPSIAIRGVGLGDNGTRTLVLLDGVPANGAFFGNVFFNRIPKERIERIEIIRGTASSQFGSLAIGGVINIITRAPGSSGELEASASVRGGSQDTLQADVAVGGSLGNGFAVGLNASHLQTDGYFLTSPEDRAPIDSRARSNVDSLSVSASYADQDRLLARLQLDYFDQEQNSGTVLSNNSTEALHLSANLQARIDPTSSFKTSLFYSDEDFSNDGTSTVERDSRAAEFVSNSHVTPAESRGASFIYSKRLSSVLQELNLGVDWRTLEGVDEQDIFTSDGALFLTQLAGGQQRFVGVFAESEWQFTESLNALASIRYDDVRNSNGRTVIDDAALLLPNRSFDRLNTRVALGYALSDDLSAHAVYARGFRAPTLAELYRRFGTSTFVGLPNADLLPETSRSGEIGLRWRKHGFSSELNAYRIRLNNQIGTVVVGFGPFTLRNENIGAGRSQGIEWINQLDFAQHWHAEFSYTHTDTEILRNLDDPALIGNQLEGAPKNTALFGLGYAPGQWHFNLRARYLDEQFQDASNETRLPSHWVVDASARYMISGNLEAFVNAENLLDNTYTASAFGGLDRRGAPLQVLAGLSWQFN